MRSAVLVATTWVTVFMADTARAGQCGLTCSTVCQDGSCDYLTINDCVTHAAGTPECRVKGGVYHESVNFLGAGCASCAACPGSCAVRLKLVCEDPVNAPCVLDGDGVLVDGITGFDDWDIEGFEIRNYLGSGITANGGSGVRSVRGCYIHDVRLRGIDNLDAAEAGVVAVAEHNRIEHTGNHGLVCRAFSDNHLVRNNILFNVAIDGGGGITCGTSFPTCNNARVEHNTVVIADNTSPYGAAPYGIESCSARYNVVVGGNTSIMTNGSDAALAHNLVSGWASAAYGGTATVDADDLTGDPLLVNREDLSLRAGSPAIDAAIGSTTSTDFTGGARSGVPDLGALEYDPAHVEDPGRWPVREVVAATPTKPASPSLIMVPGQGPAMMYFDGRAAGSDLVYAERRLDGSWTREVVKAGALMQDDTWGTWEAQTLDLALDPATGRPAAAWIDLVSTNRALRFARHLGNGCPTGDCTSTRWRGCTSTILAPSGYTGSVALAFHPTLYYPAVALSYEGNTSPYVFRVYYWDYRNGTSWQAATVEQNLTGTHFLGRGIDLSFNPATGEPEVAYTRIIKSPAGSTGELVVASRSGSTFTPLTVPIGTTFAAASGKWTGVAMAHQANGDLIVAYTARKADLDVAIAAVERVGGAWSSASVPALGHDAYTDRAYQGLDLQLDPGGEPVVATGLHNMVQVSRRFEGDWVQEAVDVRRETGDSTDLAVGDRGELLVGYQRYTVDRSIQFAATADPGGVDPMAPTTCGGGDLCVSAGCNATLGCLIAPVDCDDSDLCTADRCDPASGCVNQPIGCSDGDPCTDDGCDPASGCTHVATDCDDRDRCTVDSCDPVNGCQNVPVVCSDGNACTVDACDGLTGACTHTAISCDDGENCTLDSCDTRDGCLHQTITCDDGDLCTDDSCTLTGECRHAPVDCDDANACTVDSCSASTGACRHIDLVCDDAEFCTDDSCDTVVGCQHVDNILSCDDGDPGTIADTCLAGTCSGVPAQVVLPTIVETIAVSDTPQVIPPVVIAVVETIAVADTPQVIPPAVIAIVETIAVQDSPTVVGGVLPDGGLPDVSALDVELPDLGGGDRTSRTDAGTSSDARLRDASAGDSAVGRDAATGRDSGGNARVNPPDDEEPGCGGLGCRASAPAPTMLAALLVLGVLRRRRRR